MAVEEATELQRRGVRGVREVALIHTHSTALDTHLFARTHTHTIPLTHMHTYTHIHIYTHMHTYTP